VIAMSKSFLVDTTLCTACRGCQVACKQWHDLPAEETTNRGSYQNPADLSFDTYKLVRMTEGVVDDRLRWLFFPDQCRHCLEPPCQDTAGEPSAIFTNASTGAVIYTANTRGLNAGEIRQSCPYDIPRQAKDGTLAKCDMCRDILELAQKHLAAAQQKFPKATLLDPDDVRVVFLVGFDPGLYHEYAVASATEYGISRHAALRKMLRPFAGMVSHLG